MFYIVDARRQIAATANMASGKGTEDVSEYPHTELIYSDIENIHVMRSSFSSLLSINLAKDVISLLAAQTSGATSETWAGRFMPPAPPADGGGGQKEESSNEVNPSSLPSNFPLSVLFMKLNYYYYHCDIRTHGFWRTCRTLAGFDISVRCSGQAPRSLRNSIWQGGKLKHLICCFECWILKWSVLSHKFILYDAAYSSVLVHCSDGWDRTPQICCVAQLILDPFYRTMEGLFVLIEKDWCAFGHKFSDRCGQGDEHTSLPDERSPIFIQFLDSVHQMLLQFETAFEYNQSCLVFIADHIHSGLFGNFIGNSDKQRKQEYFVAEKTRSIWEYIGSRKQKFLNHSYVEFCLPVWPKFHLRNISFWQRYCCRWDPEAHPNLLSNHPWIDDW